MVDNMVRKMLMLGSLGHPTKRMAHQGPERRRQHGYLTVVTAAIVPPEQQSHFLEECKPLP
jgi:hypothetical protein